MAKIRAIFHLPFLPILIAPILLFSPILFTGKALYWGTPFLQFMPWRVLAWDTLRNGSWPLWNPLVGMGAPLLANYQSALFYPPTWFLFGLLAVGGTSLMAWGQTIIVIFHIVWAGMGMVFLSRSLRLNILAQTVSGLAFSLSGYLVARAGFLSINAATAWLPWILLAGWKIVSSFGKNQRTEKRTPFIRASIPLILCITLQLLAGHAQTAYYTLLLMTAWMAFWGWSAEKLTGALRAIGYLVFSFGAAAVLSAVQLLPTAEYLLQSQRAAAVSYDQVVNYSFFPLRFLTLIAPDLFGNPAHGNYLLHADNYWEDAVYIGFVPLIAAIVWALRSLKPVKKAQTNGSTFPQQPLRSFSIFLVIIIFCSFVLALGKNSPVFPFFYRYIPTFNLFQAPTRFTLLAEFGMALLAGIGINNWQRPERKTREWTRRGIAVSIAVLLGAGLGILLMAGVQVAFVQATALAGLWGICTGFLSLYIPEQESKKKYWSWIVALIVSLDLLIAGWGLNPGINTGIYSRLATGLDEVNSLRDGQRVYLDAKSEDTLKFSQFFQFNDFTQPIDQGKLLASMLPDSNILMDIPSANNFDPILPGRYAQWIDYLSNQADPKIRDFMLALMDVGLVESADATTPEGVAFRPVNAQRLQWSNCLIAAVSEEDAWNKTLALGESPGVDPNAIVLEGLSQVETTTCIPVTPAISKVVLETADKMDVAVESQADGWLMISTTWYPGWKAYVDGKEIPVIRADYLFMAINIPKGQHQISLVYQPKSFSIGGILSLTGLVLISLAFMFVKR